MQRVLWLWLAVIAACGYPPLSTSDGGVGSDGAPGTCLAKASYGNMFYAQDAEFSNPQNALLFAGNLTQGATPDRLDIVLYVGGPTFPTEIRTATIPLTGKQLAGDQCDVCVFIAAHCVGCTLDAGTPQAWYMVTQGTLAITDATMPNIGGTLSNAKFTHVTLASNGATTPVGDGCASSITSITFETGVTIVN
jgi:hypothetical protein